MARTWYTKTTGGYETSSGEAQNNIWAFYEAIREVNTTITIAAIAGILGNISAESGYNPIRWQNDTIGTGGYGLIQWTPSTSLTQYVSNHTDGNAQTHFINEEIASYNTGRMGWVWGSTVYPISQDAFMALTSPSEAAFYYLYNRERPQDPSATVDYRRSTANECYTILTGAEPPEPPDPPHPPHPVDNRPFLKKRQNYRNPYKRRTI